MWRLHCCLTRFSAELQSTFAHFISSGEATLLVLLSILLLALFPGYATVTSYLSDGDTAELIALQNNATTRKVADIMWLLDNLPPVACQAVGIIHSISYCARKIVQCFIIVFAWIVWIIYKKINNSLSLLAYNVKWSGYEELERLLRQHKVFCDIVDEYDQSCRWITFLAYLETLSILLMYMYELCKDYVAHDRAEMKDTMHVVVAWVLLIFQTGALTLISEKKEEFHKLLRYTASLEVMPKQRKKQLKSYVCEMELTDMNITVAGLQMTRETCLAIAAGILGYIILFSEMGEQNISHTGGPDANASRYVKTM
ncbi:uncharacterized protein LOC129592564 [Paramacrobiotus metropolitanus]|uniref:uncharacterized protein LOC129592564 n=1 Tax=Paramacrobiotus metropolitanus TaxID=2943436 RepID=UPI0024463A22|nr:uncharacterized protein LOC129592564 [Paramacrobiotus metropolitanus]